MNETIETPQHERQPRRTADQIIDAWAHLNSKERASQFRKLTRKLAEEVFLKLSPRDQAELLSEVSPHEKRIWIRLLALDDAADLIQEVNPEKRQEILEYLDEISRNEVLGLLAYAEDKAGGLMNPRFVRIRPDMRVDQAITYIRAQESSGADTIYYAYVLDPQQKLLGVISFRELMLNDASHQISDIMKTELIVISEETPQNEIGHLFSRHGLMAMPVIDEERKMKGIITFDDVVDVVQEDATREMQKFGGVAALEAPYLRINFWTMLKKRGGWLSILLVGEMLTATTMNRYQTDLAEMVILAIFIPLIISSGGNSGSQASTLIIRALAVRELRLRDWWRVFYREVGMGLGLGIILGALGLSRVFFWPSASHDTLRLSLTVAFSLIGVVILGTLLGSMLPFILKKLRLDPASASAPFVATIVDVSGLIIYFSIAHFFFS